MGFGAVLRLGLEQNGGKGEMVSFELTMMMMMSFLRFSIGLSALDLYAERGVRLGLARRATYLNMCVELEACLLAIVLNITKPFPHILFYTPLSLICCKQYKPR